jgi:hypothetical protein
MRTTIGKWLSEMTKPADKETGLTVAALRAVLAYDPSSGVFTWRKKINQAVAAGWRSPKSGYLVVKVFGHKYMAHRLAWFYVHGRWPSVRIDHKNINRGDDRIDNLREATEQQNTANRRGKSGRALPKGIEEFRPGRFRARLMVDGHIRDVGYFDNPQDASVAYAAAAKASFGEFARSA